MSHVLLRRLKRASRERGYRRALAQAGFTPGSIELAVLTDDEWLTTGDDTLDPRGLNSRWERED